MFINRHPINVAVLSAMVNEVIKMVRQKVSGHTLRSKNTKIHKKQKNELFHADSHKTKTNAFLPVKYRPGNLPLKDEIYD